jgi:hypothetical protein
LQKEEDYAAASTTKLLYLSSEVRNEEAQHSHLAEKYVALKRILKQN